MTILIGTASWSSKTLVDSGRFYPPSVANSAEARLRYYASVFPIVEVDSSYYAMPTPPTAQLWAERTPNGFTMNVKAFRLFTGHQTAPRVLPPDIRAALPPSAKATTYYHEIDDAIRDEIWRRFVDALVPLRAADKLGLVHFQFPPWIIRNAAGHAHVRHCIERMAGHRLSVEFRHRSWFADAHATASTLAFERELGVIHTIVDAPQGFANSVPAVWAVTNPACVLLRLHGRNRATWNIKGASDSSERFNYDYPDAELSELALQIEREARHADAMHVIFNNNLEDQGQRNAMSLTQLLAPR